MGPVANFELEPNLLDYWNILKKRRYVFLGTFSLVYISALVYTRRIVPLYRSQAVVRYEPPGKTVIGGDWNRWDQIVSLNTQIRLITSPHMAQRTAKKMGLAAVPAISASEVEKANMITLSVAHPDPNLAADVLGAALAVYSELDFELRSQSVRKTLDDVQVRREEVDSALSELEERKREYLEANPTLNAQGALAVNLLELETRHKDLLRKFTTDHPEAASLHDRIVQLRAKIDQIPTKTLDLERINRELDVSKELYIGLSRQAEEARIALSAIPSYITIMSPAEVPTAPFYPDKPKNNMLAFLGAVVLGLAAVGLRQSLDISMSTIEEIEAIAGVPVLGVVPHLGRHPPWKTLWWWLIRRHRFPTEDFRSMLLVNQSLGSPALEIYHGIRSGIQTQLARKDGLVLVITSTGVAEGKTLTAINFCLAAAHAGLKTLLIAADIRRPVVHRILGLPKQEGLCDILAGQAEWEDRVLGAEDLFLGAVGVEKLLEFSGIGNLKVIINSSSAPSDVVNVFGSPKLPEFIRDVRSRFDFVVFDCPPALLFIDALLVGAHSDGAVMIYQSGKMPRQALKRAKEQLAASQVKLLGVILNDIRAGEMGPGYTYSYYYGYEHYARKADAETEV